MNTTTQPIEQTTGACLPVKPEWLRLPDAIRMSGIGRSTLYQLLGDGSIKSVLLRKRGRQRGIRLISADSLRAFIKSFATEGLRENEIRVFASITKYDDDQGLIERLTELPRLKYDSAFGGRSAPSKESGIQSSDIGADQ